MLEKLTFYSVFQIYKYIFDRKGQTCRFSSTCAGNSTHLWLKLVLFEDFSHFSFCIFFKIIAFCFSSKRGKMIPDIGKILKLFQTVINETSYGRQVVLRHSGDKVLQTFRANFESSLSADDSKTLSLVLGSLLDRDRSSVDISIQSGKSDSISVVSSSSSSTCFTPADLVFFFQQKWTSLIISFYWPCI